MALVVVFSSSTIDESELKKKKQFSHVPFHS